MERTTGFERATLTLAKEKETHLLRQDCRTPLSSLSPVSLSAQSAESARLQRLTFNALNVYVCTEHLQFGCGLPIRDRPGDYDLWTRVVLLSRRPVRIVTTAPVMSAKTMAT